MLNLLLLYVSDMVTFHGVGKSAGKPREGKRRGRADGMEAAAESQKGGERVQSNSAYVSTEIRYILSLILKEKQGIMNEIVTLLGVSARLPRRSHEKALAI